MRKWFTLFTIIILLFAISGCGSQTEETCTESEIANPIPTYESIEYWDIVQDEIISMLNEHNLYISNIESGYPYVFYTVEPGIRAEGSRIIATGLSLDEYEELFQHIKEELHIILDKYMLLEPKTPFHSCYSNVRIYFKNWFIDMPMIPGVSSSNVASYGLDLLQYYHAYEDNSYVNVDSFYSEVWANYEVYYYKIT